jgi:hypothetical protein
VRGTLQRELRLPAAQLRPELRLEGIASLVVTVAGEQEERAVQALAQHRPVHATAEVHAADEARVAEHRQASRRAAERVAEDAGARGRGNLARGQARRGRQRCGQ